MIFLLNFVHFDAIFADSETDLLILKQKSPTDWVEDILTYRPIHDVAPSAVRIAEAIDAINCTINLVVSFLLIVYSILIIIFALVNNIKEVE